MADNPGIEIGNTSIHPEGVGENRRARVIPCRSPSGVTNAMALRSLVARALEQPHGECSPSLPGSGGSQGLVNAPHRYAKAPLRHTLSQQKSRTLRFGFSKWRRACSMGNLTHYRTRRVA